MPAININAVFVTLAIFVAGCIFQAGRLSSRVDLLEQLMRDFRADVARIRDDIRDLARGAK